jgi:hypothetical protein
MPSPGFDREAYNSAPIIPGSKKVWFLNNDLVRTHHVSRSTGMTTVYNINKDRLETCFTKEFKKNRERAYTVGEAAILVNRHKKYMPSLMKRGVIPEPVGASQNGERGWQIRCYYSESKIHEIRDILATYHMGRPRNDKLITNDITPSYQELTRRMGNGILTYTRTEDGRYIPVWAESI